MDMYLSCNSQEEIAAAVDMTQKSIANKIEDFSNLGNIAKNTKTLANQETKSEKILRGILFY